VMSFREIENLMPLKEPADMTRMFWSLLKIQALTYFEHHLRIRLKAEDSELPDNDLLEIMLRELYTGLEYTHEQAILIQKYCMRWGLYLDLNISIQIFVETLNDLTRYLLYFPEENPKQLDQD
jgi:hypothetical protein